MVPVDHEYNFCVHASLAIHRYISIPFCVPDEITHTTRIAELSTSRVRLYEYEYDLGWAERLDRSKYFAILAVRTVRTIVRNKRFQAPQSARPRQPESRSVTALRHYGITALMQ